jgi:flagellar biosynthetic protein FlhB
MSDQQDKTEEASSFKLEEARKKGQVPKSQELLSFAMTLAFLMIFSATIFQVARTLAQTTHWWLSNADSLGASWGYMRHQAGFALEHVVNSLMPLVGALVVVAILTNLLFSGPVFSLASIKPDFKRLNPIAGLKKIFSRRMFVELLKLLVKGALFCMVLYYVAQSLLPDLLGVATVSPMALPPAAKSMLMQMGFALLAVMGAAALFEMWYARRDFARQMRMSKREQKDEYRRREGDPEVRSRRKGIQQELLKKTAALGQVKDADVIIVNPIHYAVALQYRPSVMRAPLVLAMGRGIQAQRICRVARRNGVPILRRPPLARLLHALGRANSPIPDSTQNDVASVYRWIIALPGNKVVAG